MKMFTGLVETVGTVASVLRRGRGVTLCVKADLREYDVAVGGSVAIDGVCLTAEKIDDGAMTFSAMPETLSRSTLQNVVAGRRVNLERAMPANGRLDGHIVLGHVDIIGKIISDVKDGASVVRTIQTPQEFMPLIAQKGSVAIDGVSLTVANVSSNTFTISLIPETLKRTTLFEKKIGGDVNIECDVLARYIYNILKHEKSSGENLIDKMKALGY